MNVKQTTDIAIRELSPSDVHPAMLDGFVRTQEIARCWRLEGGQWVLRDNPYIEDWDEEKRQGVIESFQWGMEHGGCAHARLFGAKKLYISAASSEASQAFYAAMGCVDALEIDREQAEEEPYDRQMEAVL